MGHFLSCAFLLLVLVQGSTLSDDRNEVRQRADAFAKLAQDPDKDADAVALLDGLVALFKESGPHDRAHILNAVVPCVRLFDAPRTKDKPRRLPVAAAEHLCELGAEGLRVVRELLADARINHEMPRVVPLAAGLAKLGLGSPEALDAALSMLDDSNPRLFAGLAPALSILEPDTQARRKRVCGELLRTWETFSLRANKELDALGERKTKFVEDTNAATLATLNALALQRQPSLPKFKAWYARNKSMDWPQSLAPFAYQSMKVNGHPALGTRPLLVLLAEYTGAAYPPYSKTHPASYYRQLAFGVAPARPFATPGNPASLSAFVKENSNGRFQFTRAGSGVVGPLSMNDFYATDPGPEQRSADILARAADLALVRFSAFDANRDGAVGSDELVVLIVENIPMLMPANRISNSIVVSDSGGKTTLRVAVAFAGPATPFYQIAHETMHSLGTRDMYNSGNHLLTTMGAYSFYADDQATVSLDAWHKFVLGWIEPRVYQIHDPTATAIEFDRETRTNGSALLWDPSHGAGEFFLLERRASADQEETAPLYDANVADTGVVIWRAGPVVAACGAPSMAMGGSGMWKSGTVSPPLIWSNGMNTNTAIKFTTTPAGSPLVMW